jgi:hypothetical protein
MPKRAPRESTPPVQVIDLTGGDTPFRYVEIRTDAGIIRVNAGLVTGTEKSRVVVEVEPNTRHHRSGCGDGNWWVSHVQDKGSRYEVKITRGD